MHIHPSQINPNAQLDGLQSAHRAQAKAEAARTRKKLMDSASALAGEAATEAYIVEVESNEDPGGHRRERGKWGRPKLQAAPAESNDGDHSLEDWA